MIAGIPVALLLLVPQQVVATAVGADDNAHLERLVRRAGTGVRWLRDPYRRHDLRGGVGAQQPYSPPVDRGALLELALARAKSRKRIVLAYVWRIEGRPMYRAPLLDHYMRLAVWSDPETVALVNRKFVPLRLYADRKVAKRLGVYNADPQDELYLAAVEPALVFLSPEGEVLHRVERIRTFSTHWVRHVLMQVLRRHREYDAPSDAVRVMEESDDVDALVWLARQQCLDGQEEVALATLERAAKGRLRKVGEQRAEVAALEKRKPESGTREHRMWSWQLRRLTGRIEAALTRTLDLYLVRAQALRLARRADEALTTLQVALRELGGTAGGENAFWLEEARCHFARGDVTAAAKSLAGAGKSSEAEWWRGVAAWRSWKLEAARAHFRRAAALGEAPFHWRAAAMLATAADTTPFSPLAHGYELTGYGPDRIYEVRLPTTSELPRLETPAKAKPAIVRAAFDFLLAHQRPDGAWTDARYVWSGTDILPNVHVAVTALAATALLQWRELDPPRVDAALAKAERCLRDDGRIAFGKEEEVYSQAYRMLYWTRRASVFGKEGARFENVEALVKRAAAIQDKETGFFAHEYPNAFCTGAMMWSLYLAKTMGVAIEDDVIHLGVKALRSARRADGSFAYGGSAPQRDTRRPGGESITRLKDSSARMPVCEAVLHAFGSSDQAKIEKAFKTFLDYLDRIARVRKCDFHSDGQLAGFFFWHAMFHATEVQGLVEDDALRRRFVARMLDLVTSFPELDGSFVDSHELGKSYGTAMALLVLANLGKGE